MASITEKPTSLPIFNQGKKAKKQSFSPFDKIRSIFSRKSPESDNLPRVPVITTPTEESSKKFVVDKSSMSQSAENISKGEGSDFKSKGLRVMLAPPNTPTQKATSSESLAWRDLPLTEATGSTECLDAASATMETIHCKVDRGAKASSSPDQEKQLEETGGGGGGGAVRVVEDERETPAVPEAAQGTTTTNGPSSSPGGDVSEESSNPQTETTTTTMMGVDLNVVSRTEVGLNHQAARHRQVLKVKGRRPPTVYQFTSHGNTTFPEMKIPSLPVPSSSPAGAKSSEGPEVRVNAASEEKPGNRTHLSSKPSVLQHLKRNKAFVPRLDDIRRKTISNFQVTESPADKTAGAETNQESSPPSSTLWSARNSSFKVKRNDAEVKPAAPVELKSDLQKLERQDLKPTANRGGIGAAREQKVPEVNIPAWKNRLVQKMESSPSSSSSSCSPPLPSSSASETTAPTDERQERGNRVPRPQSRYVLQASTALSMVGVSKSEKPDEAKAKENAESRNLNKSEKFPPLKKATEDKSPANGQVEKIVDQPAFKKVLKHVDKSLLASDDTTADKSPPEKSLGKSEVSPGPKPEGENGTDNFESVRQKFRKSDSEAGAGSSKASQVHPVALRIHSDSQKIGADGKGPQPTTSAPVPKKSDNRLTFVPKQIPPEPFRVASDVGKQAASQDNTTNTVSPSKGIPSKPKISFKENVQQQQQSAEDPPNPFRAASLKKVQSARIQKESPAGAPKEATGDGNSSSKRGEPVDKVAVMRAASGANLKTAPNKLKFNPDDWMAKRRENLEST